MWVTAPRWRSEDKVWALVSPPTVWVRDQTQLSKLGSRHLVSADPFSSPEPVSQWPPCPAFSCSIFFPGLVQAWLEGGFMGLRVLSCLSQPWLSQTDTSPMPASLFILYPCFPQTPSYFSSSLYHSILIQSFLSLGKLFNGFFFFLRKNVQVPPRNW